MAQDPSDDPDAKDDSEATEPVETDSLADPEGRVLDPGELDFTERAEVSELGDGRFIVSAGARGDSPDGSDGTDGSMSTPPTAPADPTADESMRQGAEPTTNAREATAIEGPNATEVRSGVSDRTDGTDGTDDGRNPAPGSGAEPAPTTDPDTGSESGGGDAVAVDAESVADWLAESMTDNGFAHGFDATLKFDGSVSRHRMVSTEVDATFETLLLWYARQVDDERPVEGTLGRLLADSEVPVAVPPEAVVTALCHHGLSREDTVADLLAAVERDGGLELSTR